MNRATINPYRIGLSHISRRLKWDLSPLAWKSRKKLRRQANKYVSQKALILCNGPSLNKVDFDRVSKHKIFTFGLNKINLLFDRTEFRPSCIVAVNPHVIDQNSIFFNQTDIPLFIDSYGTNRVHFRKNVTFLHSAYSRGLFARDCSMSIIQGGTVTYVAMQLAFHMGFDTLGLVGCDHSFTFRGMPNEKVTAGKTDENHFHPQYFSSGVSWNLPDLATSEFHYTIARDTFRKNNRKIINCTEGGKLEVFERILLDRFLQG